MSGTASNAAVVPASLSYLAIYNPSLNTSDETLRDQIVYFFDKQADGCQERNSPEFTQDGEAQAKENRRLRYIGLAQGMIQFSGEFAEGAPIDCIETDKSRTIVHNLDGEWWLLASVELTCISRHVESSLSADTGPPNVNLEYSSREVSPPGLLLQQLLRAHGIFLIHHGETLSELWAKNPRDKFCRFLRRFWDNFLTSWDVLLHGNPAVDIYNGIKLSAGGELGIGVGEEDWGSGEREILEDFVRRTEGLVDLVVSRFDHLQDTEEGAERSMKPTGHSGPNHASPSDGVIFSGLGNLTRASVRSTSAWMEWLADYRSDAFGVQDNPSSERRRRRAKVQRPRDLPTEGLNVSKRTHASSEDTTKEHRPSIPAPIVRPKDGMGTAAISLSKQHATILEEHQEGSTSSPDEPALATEVMKYLTLGVYGSSWGIPIGRPGSQNPAQRSQRKISKDAGSAINALEKRPPSDGRFLIGLLGNIEDDRENDHNAENLPDINQGKTFSGRISMRQLHVELVNVQETAQAADDTDRCQTATIFPERLRIVVYIHGPFMFTFFFRPNTDSLSLPYFYRSLHHQLGPLRGPLMRSTNPAKVAQRIWDAVTTRSSAVNRSPQPIQDLVHDPVRLTIHTTIPNIPQPLPGGTNSTKHWSRIEALNVHSQIVNNYGSTRRHAAELERTCKTGRGWWVVWMRLPPSDHVSAYQFERYREAVLIRKANDYAAPKSSQRSSSLGFGLARGGESATGGWGSSKLVEGIGVDARQYIEGLLSLSR